MLLYWVLQQPYAVQVLLGLSMGAGKWSRSTWLEGDQGTNYFAYQCKYARTGAFQFFSLVPHTFLSVLFSCFIDGEAGSWKLRNLFQVTQGVHIRDTNGTRAA